ncbi:hypothetical protein Y981_10900 [Leptospirillum ferriphilum YSK]|uniref:Uncharacterized protein n=1 Tax=Leptospirillum ferriphilum YSK TaxID=1441628 RepID=A0A059XTJ9_9BACT|nr:hypothetical protein Y981_10900 [Leptospirillum ferriphilum YSK]
MLAQIFPLSTGNTLQKSVRSFIMTGAFLSSLLLTGCGNLFSGVGGSGTGTLQGAETTALADIASGNYAGAAAALSSYCPNDTCPDPTSATILADAYIALGSAPDSAYNAASGSYTGTNQIISNLISASSSSSSANQTFQAIAQAVPCITNNNCTQSGLSTLLTALNVLANSGCTVTACTSDLASMELLAAGVYILANIQSQTGITYNTQTGWEQCLPGGGGTASCSMTISTSSFNLSSTDLANDCYLLYNSLSPLSACGTPSSSLSQTASLVSLMGTLSSSLGSSGTNVTNSINEFLNSVIGCTSPSSCFPSTQTSTPTSLSGMSSFQTNIEHFLTNIAYM